MTFKNLMLPLVAAAALVGFSSAKALIVDMDGASILNACSTGTLSPVDIGYGFQISFASGDGDICPALGAGSVPVSTSFTGNYFYGYTGSFEVSRADDATFTLNGFDFDHINIGEPIVNTLNLQNSNGDNVNVTSDDAFSSVQTFDSFDDFSDIMSFSINASSFGIDNINVDVNNAPEPSTLGIFGLGMLAFGLVKRRRA